MHWIIYNTEEPSLCWSNTDGWTEENFDTFTDEQKAVFTLPIGGAWERVPWTVKQ